MGTGSVFIPQPSQIYSTILPVLQFLEKKLLLFLSIFTHIID